MLLATGLIVKFPGLSTLNNGERKNSSVKDIASLFLSPWWCWAVCCWWDKTESPSRRREIAQENTPLSLASMDNWWSRLFSASLIIRPKSLCAAATACDRLLPNLCSYFQRKKKDNSFRRRRIIKYSLFRLWNRENYLSRRMTRWFGTGFATHDLVRPSTSFQQDLLNDINLILDLFYATDERVRPV